MTMRAKYRERLPQLDGGLFLTDGGLETTLIFHEGWDLPCFAAFVLLDSERGRKALRDYFDRYVPMAIAAGAGFILESPTWRANSDWARSSATVRRSSASTAQPSTWCWTFGTGMRHRHRLWSSAAASARAATATIRAR